MVRRTANEIQAWLICQLAVLQQVSPDRIDPGESWTELGLDSVRQLELELTFETWLGCKLPQGIFWDYPTIESLCRYLANEQ